jgi:hypothetical protein
LIRDTIDIFIYRAQAAKPATTAKTVEYWIAEPPTRLEAALVLFADDEEFMLAPAAIIIPPVPGALVGVVLFDAAEAFLAKASIVLPDAGLMYGQ